MSNFLTEKTFSEIFLKISEIRTISQSLYCSEKFNEYAHNEALLEIINSIADIFVFLLDTSQVNVSESEKTKNWDKEKIYAQVLKSYNLMKAYEAEFC